MEGAWMARGKKHTPEQIVNVLRQVEVVIANGKTPPAPVRKPDLRNRSTIGGARNAVV
jgi:hypothetical protein